MDNKKIKTLELFGGIGAPRSALERLDLDIKAIDYVEILSNAVKAYNAMYDHEYKSQDVLTWNLNVDLLIHGSPCQDFSIAGLNDLSSGRSILYQRTLEIIEKELQPRPKYVVWENVVGLISIKNYEHYDHYIESMEALGYTSYKTVLYANEFGIPQKRGRVFTISIRNDINQTFDFDVLEKKPLQDTISFLENNITYPYDRICKSMVDSIYNGKTKIIVNCSATITCKQVRWNNGGMVVKDLSFYKQDFSNIKVKACYSWNECVELFPKWFKDKKPNEILRYLTPRECWLLQGFTNEQYDKVLAQNIPTADLYALAGNSICVDVLEAIFKELLIDNKSSSLKYVVNPLKIKGDNKNGKQN